MHFFEFLLLLFSVCAVPVVVTFTTPAPRSTLSHPNDIKKIGFSSLPAVERRVDPGAPGSDGDPDPSNRALFPDPGSGLANTLSVLLRLPPQWSIRDWETTATFLPIANAANDVELFYQELFQRAASAFWADTSSSYVLVSWGRLQFFLMYQPPDPSVEVGGDFPHVSMAVMASLAHSLLDLAKRGYVAAWNAIIADPDGNTFYMDFGVENDEQNSPDQT